MFLTFLNIYKICVFIHNIFTVKLQYKMRFFAVIPNPRTAAGIGSSISSSSPILIGGDIVASIKHYTASAAQNTSCVNVMLAFLLPSLLSTVCRDSIFSAEEVQAKMLHFTRCTDWLAADVGHFSRSRPWVRAGKYMSSKEKKACWNVFMLSNQPTDQASLLPGWPGRDPKCVNLIVKKWKILFNICFVTFFDVIKLNKFLWLLTISRSVCLYFFFSTHGYRFSVVWMWMCNTLWLLWRDVPLRPSYYVFVCASECN